MKFVLFVCISLVANLLHASLMPMGSHGNTSTTHEFESAEYLSSGKHAKPMHSDNESTDVFCGDHMYSCCITLVLQLDSVVAVLFIRGAQTGEFYELNPPQFRPALLYKPPKFYSVSTG